MWKINYTFKREVHEEYLMPQENGSNYATEWAVVSNLLGMGLLCVGMDDFSFNASHFTPQDLAEAMHPHELTRREQHDYRQQCGNSGRRRPANHGFHPAVLVNRSRCAHGYKRLEAFELIRR